MLLFDRVWINSITWRLKKNIQMKRCKFGQLSYKMAFNVFPKQSWIVGRFSGRFGNTCMVKKTGYCPGVAQKHVSSGMWHWFVLGLTVIQEFVCLMLQYTIILSMRLIWGGGGAAMCVLVSLEYLLCQVKTFFWRHTSYRMVVFRKKGHRVVSMWTLGCNDG